MGRDEVSKAQQHIEPFDRSTVVALLPFGLDDAVYLEITHEESLWSASLEFLAKLVTDVKSLRFGGVGGVRKGIGKGFDSDDEDFLKGKGKGRGPRKVASDPEPVLGLGWHPFTLKHGEEIVEMWALHQRLTCYSNPWHSLVLFTKGPDSSPLVSFCKLAREAATEPQERTVRMMRFSQSHGMGHWSSMAVKVPRSLDSVVLDAKVKQALLEDVDWFVEKETRNFYYKHGIAYHRCYLLHGPPGSGKTSMISALAGRLRRNLCFLQMTPSMTDDSLGKAMSGLDKNSMLVLEDVDALFTNHREATSTTSSLSFSGFINSLDGLGAPEDVLIFMTSNHPEKLDQALLRPGRVDLQIEFKSPGKEAAAEYFKTFYPEAEEAAAKFNETMGEDIASRRVSMAQLQHFFLKCHRLKLEAAQVADYAKEHDFKISWASKQYS